LKTIVPSLGLSSYSCPHCGALAQQSWFRVFIDALGKEKPVLLDPEDIEGMRKSATDPREVVHFQKTLNRLSKNVLTFHQSRQSQNCENEMANMAMGLCHACDGFTVWVNGEFKYPVLNAEHVAHVDMPADVKLDFEEASSICQRSPRGAAALLRLAIQKLMPHLGERGRDINEDIGSLVGKGLDPVVKQALDVVRVVGNHAVHPGKIDFDDNPETASRLFAVVNIIVATMISAKKQIEEMFANLPDGARAAIEARDQKFIAKASAPQPPKP
jgi:hypothetical protein